MNQLFQVRMKTCEDEGDVFRSSSNLYSTYDNAIMALRAEVKGYEALFAAQQGMLKLDIIFHPELNNYRAELLIEDIPYLQAWIQPMHVIEPAINERTAAALLDAHKRNAGRLLSK